MNDIPTTIPDVLSLRDMPDDRLTQLLSYYKRVRSNFSGGYDSSLLASGQKKAEKLFAAVGSKPEDNRPFFDTLAAKEADADYWSGPKMKARSDAAEAAGFAQEIEKEQERRQDYAAANPALDFTKMSTPEVVDYLMNWGFSAADATLAADDPEAAQKYITQYEANIASGMKPSDAALNSAGPYSTRNPAPRNISLPGRRNPSNERGPGGTWK